MGLQNTGIIVSLEHVTRIDIDGSETLAKVAREINTSGETGRRGWMMCTLGPIGYGNVTAMLRQCILYTNVIIHGNIMKQAQAVFCVKHHGLV